MLRSELWLVARQAATPSMSAGGAAEGAAEGTAGGPPLILGVEQRTINGVALGCVLGTCAIGIALCFRRARSGPRHFGCGVEVLILRGVQIGDSRVGTCSSETLELATCRSETLQFPLPTG